MWFFIQVFLSFCMIISYRFISSCYVFRHTCSFYVLHVIVYTYPFYPFIHIKHSITYIISSPIHIIYYTYHHIYIIYIHPSSIYLHHTYQKYIYNISCKRRCQNEWMNNVYENCVYYSLIPRRQGYSLSITIRSLGCLSSPDHLLSLLYPLWLPVPMVFAT